MKRIKIIIENEIDLIPYRKRRKTGKMFEFKFLFVRLIIEGII